MKTFNNEQPETQRNSDRTLLKAFGPFKLCGQDRPSTDGNIHFELGQICYMVSAPMLLARLVSGGMSPMVLGQEGYKITWEVALKHETTGAILTFYDWKGGASYGSCGSSDIVFLADVKALLAALTNPRFPHPYDGCVVGEIA